MTRARLCAASSAALAVLPAVASAGTAGIAPVEEPVLVSLTTFAAVIGAFVLALLIVAAVRRADR